MIKNSLKAMTFCLIGVMVCAFGGCDKCCRSCGGSENQKTKKQIVERKGMRKRSDTSSLEWEIIKEGEGETPKAGQRVVVHYTGWLDENGKPGKKFDSSIDRGRPFEFTIGIGHVIKGWDEGVMKMKKGEKRVLYIPASLGYGARGAGAIIPPNADLIFEVELLDIK
jgi:FKBP-type peptidyl-prolyl cis-trans isomerase